LERPFSEFYTFRVVQAGLFRFVAEPIADWLR
jgi:hypothetical protein